MHTRYKNCLSVGLLGASVLYGCHADHPGGSHDAGVTDGTVGSGGRAATTDSGSGGATGGSTPSNGGSTPSNGGSTPSNGGSTPSNGGSTPSNGGAAGSGGTMSAGGTGTAGAGAMINPDIDAGDAGPDASDGGEEDAGGPPDSGGSLGGDGAHCLTDQDCESAFTCIGTTTTNLCAHAQCTVNSDCSAGHSCLLSKGVCVLNRGPGEDCGGPGDNGDECIPGYHCAAVGTPSSPRSACIKDDFQCPHGIECGRGFYCRSDLAAPTCMFDVCASCNLETEYCSGDFTTTPFSCQPKTKEGEYCNDPNGCLRGFYCNVVTNVCERWLKPGDPCTPPAGGLNQLQCGEGADCDSQQQICVARAPLGTPCGYVNGDLNSTPVTCGPGLACITAAPDGTCTPRKPCKADFDCPGALHCVGGGESLLCVKPPCNSDADCPAGTKCAGVTCLPYVNSGDSCAQAQPCAPGTYCSNGAGLKCKPVPELGDDCGVAPDYAQCVAPLHCHLNKCVPPAPLNGSCDQQGDCAAPSVCGFFDPATCDDTGGSYCCHALGQSGDFCSGLPGECGGGLYCDFDSICKSRIVIGGACNPTVLTDGSGPCTLDAFCATDPQKCQARGKPGDFCVGYQFSIPPPGACSGTAICDGTVCGPSCPESCAPSEVCLPGHVEGVCR